MLPLPVQKTAILFWVLVLIELAGIQLNLQWINYLVKPLLMPALMMLLLTAGDKRSVNKIVLTGLFFSWLGDVFLLFDDQQPVFFILGLASFLITHCCYIAWFLAPRSSTVSLLKKRPFIILLVILYGATLFYFLLPYLGALKVPVLVYATVICCMLLSTFHIYLKVNFPAGKRYLAGAFLFVISDTLLAVNKFYQPVFLAGIFIMLSYCAAQYFIVKGCIAEWAANKIISYEEEILKGAP